MELKFTPNADKMCLIWHVVRLQCGNPNRGEDNAPKTIAQGKVLRARCSMQSVNAALRKSVHENLPEWAGMRTGKIVQVVKERGAPYFPNPDELAEVAASIGVGLRGKETSDNDNDPTKTQPIMFGYPEVDEMLRQLAAIKAKKPDDFKTFLDPMAVVEQMYFASLDGEPGDGLSQEDKDALKKISRGVLNADKLKKKPLALKIAGLPEKTSKWTKEITDQIVHGIVKLAVEDADGFKKFLATKPPKVGEGSAKTILTILTQIELERMHPTEVALFGRFNASKESPFATIPRSLYPLGAFAVHEYVESNDFFTCMDDLAGPKEAGAGHVGRHPMKLHMSLCYEYYGLNLGEFIKHLPKGDDPEKKVAEIIPVLNNAIWFLQLIGNRKQGGNSYRPELMLLEVRRDNQMTSYLPAFLNPVVVDNELSIKSVKKLIQYAVGTQEGCDGVIKTFAATTNKEDYGKMLPKNFGLGTFSELPGLVMEAIKKSKEV